MNKKAITDTHIQKRNAGIRQALDNADDKISGWSDTAYNFLESFVQGVKNQFMIEDVRSASEGIVPTPPSNRAWGGVALRAAKSGLIKKMGHGQVKNMRAHCAYATVWAVS